MEIIGISGASCSGKSTLTARLQKRLGRDCQVMRFDNYYFPSDLPFEERAMTNHDLPQAFDWDLLKHHIALLKTGVSIESPVYSYREHNQTGKTVTISPTKVLIIEGIHALHCPGILEHLTLKVFLESDPAVRRERRIQRDLQERSADINHVLKKYDEQTEPTFRQFESILKSQAQIATNDIVKAETEILKVLSEK